MFTGIIQDIGMLNQVDNGLYVVTTNLNLNGSREGSSISCNGVSRMLCCMIARS